MARKIIQETEPEPEGNIEDILALEGSPARRENTRARDAKEKREQIKKEALESFHKAKEEFNITNYENIKVV